MWLKYLFIFALYEHTNKLQIGLYSEKILSLLLLNEKRKKKERKKEKEKREKEKKKKEKRKKDKIKKKK